MELLSNHELEQLTPSQRKEYYEKLKEQCATLNNSQLKIGQRLIKDIYPFLRGYKIEIQGEENIPKDSNVIFLTNHSNSHDIFTAYEFLSMLQRKGSAMVATDCLNPLTSFIFNISNASLLDRRIKNDRKESVLKMSNKVLNGSDGVIFGEGTWNLHPTYVMHNIHQGISKIAAITQRPIIPTIFEYIEKEDIFNTENKLYKKCIIRFGKPIMINYNEDLITQTNRLKEAMINLRKSIWRDYQIIKDNLECINPTIYLNHTYIKKFKAFGFTYDSEKEQEFLLFLNGEPKENEYCLSKNNTLSPGITKK